MNLSSVLRITAKVSGIREFTKLDHGIKKTEKAAQAAEKGFKKMLDSRLFRAAATAAAGLSAAIALSTKAAVEFETSMAEVRKVMDGLSSPEAFKEISQDVLDLSSKMPIAAKGFAEIFAAAGQAGIPREEVKQFAEQVAQTAIAFDMTAEEAGTAMAKIKTSLGLSLPELRNVTDAINHLSNTSASSADQLVDFTLRAGAVGQSAGLSAIQTAAFGSAMISAGADSNVAATSFRNVVKALSRGPSMTDRQIGALTRLGFAQDSAVTNEKMYSDAVRFESETRIEIARTETNQLAKELNRRFRDQMTSVRDGMDDATEAYTEGLQDQAEQQIKALQRQERQEIDSAQKRAEALGRSSRDEVYAIQDAFERRIDAVRDKLQDELKVRRRADRDKLTAIQDDMDDRRELELKGLESNFKEIQEKEKVLMKERLAKIEAEAKAGATRAAEALAKGLQEDAIGTITDVFDRIRQLPKEAQLSVISDLFGDEARAIQPLITNSNLLKDALASVADESNFAGSTLGEYLTRTATVGNQTKLARQQLENLAIVFGGTFAPALGALMQVLSPVVNAFTWMLTNIPILGPLIGVLSVAFIGLVAALPILASIVSIITQLGGATATLAVLKTALVSLGGAFAALKGAFAVIVGIFSGPVGWIALIAAALAAIYAFRTQIGGIFNEIGALIGHVFTTIGSLIQAPFQAFVGWISETFFNPVRAKFEEFKGFVEGIWKQFTKMLTAPFRSAAEGLKGIFNNILQNIAGVINQAIRLLNGVISGANRLPGVSIPLISQIEIPKFAKGGMVDGAQLAVVGEAGPEYIVPAGKAQGFAQNILAGVRGPAAIPAFAEGGYVGPVNITTGPVMQQGGTNYVTMAQFEKGVRDAANAVMRNGRSYGARRYTGIS